MHVVQSCTRCTARTVKKKNKPRPTEATYARVAVLYVPSRLSKRRCGARSTGTRPPALHATRRLVPLVSQPWPAPVKIPGAAYVGGSGTTHHETRDPSPWRRAAVARSGTGMRVRDTDPNNRERCTALRGGGKRHVSRTCLSPRTWTCMARWCAARTVPGTSTLLTHDDAATRPATRCSIGRHPPLPDEKGGAERPAD